MEEYKGIFYNDNSEKIYYEGGAHFKYKDLVRELTFIKKQRESQISSLSNLSTNDIKTQPPLKKCIIIQKMPNIRENSMGRNIHQNNKKKLIFTKNIRNKYDEKMPLLNNRNNSLQQKNNINVQKFPSLISLYSEISIPMLRILFVFRSVTSFEMFPSSNFIAINFALVNLYDQFPRLTFVVSLIDQIKFAAILSIEIVPLSNHYFWRFLNNLSNK